MVEPWAPPSFDTWMALGDRWRDWYIANHWTEALAWEGWDDNDASIIAYWMIAAMLGDFMPLPSITERVSPERIDAFNARLVGHPSSSAELRWDSLAVAGLVNFKRPAAAVTNFAVTPQGVAIPFGPTKPSVTDPTQSRTGSGATRARALVIRRSPPSSSMTYAMLLIDSVPGGLERSAG